MPDTWTTKAPLPLTGFNDNAQTKRGFGVIGTKLYIIGVRTTTNPPTYPLLEWNQVTNVWRVLANVPFDAANVASGVIGNKLYIAAGEGFTTVPSIKHKTLYEWDQVTEAWTQKADMPLVQFQSDSGWGIGGTNSLGGSASYRQAGGQSPGSGAIGSKFYVVGGLGSVASAVRGVNTLLEWDQATDTWTEKARLPYAVYDLTVNVIGSKLYAVGGNGSANVSGGSIAQYVRYLFEWDQATDTWTQKANMPRPVNNASGGVIGTKMYIAGGNSWVRFQNTLFEWDQATDTWTQKADIPIPIPPFTDATGIWGHMGDAIGTKLYVVGGTLRNNDKNRQLYEWSQ